MKLNSKKVAGHRGLILKRRPKEYVENEPQRVLREISQQCGVKKGITKAEMQRLMKECVGPSMRKYYEKKNDKR